MGALWAFGCADQQRWRPVRRAGHGNYAEGLARRGGNQPVRILVLHAGGCPAHNQPGCIVNITAVVERATPGIAHTKAARAGTEALTRTLCVEWAPLGIRVNCVEPGVIASPGLAHYPATARPSFTHNPMRRLGDVQDIAEACAYLAAPSARFVTGVVVPVDGGSHAWGEYWPLGKPAYFRIDEGEVP